MRLVNGQFKVQWSILIAWGLIALFGLAFWGTIVVLIGEVV